MPMSDQNTPVLPDAPLQESALLDLSAKVDAALAQSADEPQAEPAKYVDIPDDMDSLNVRRDQLAKLRTAPPEEKVHPTPALTERQKSVLEEEMAAGRRRVAAAQAQKAELEALRVRLKEEEAAKQGTMTPVPVNADYVPDMNHGYTGARTVRE
jgi:hypothetical protein